MIGKRFRSLPFIFANENYTLRGKCDKLILLSIIKQEGTNPYRCLDE